MNSLLTFNNQFFPIVPPYFNPFSEMNLLLFEFNCINLDFGKYTQVELVTAEGSVITANANQNADLYWAMRGFHMYVVYMCDIYQI
jgi:hypothetical protein